MSVLTKGLLIPSLFTVSVTIIAPVAAADARWGQTLYDETEFSRMMNGEFRDDVTCADCHEPEFYTREGRKAEDYERLLFWVNSCNDMLGVGWFPDEVDVVADYLNEQYYQYPKTD